MKVEDYSFPRNVPVEIKEMLDNIRRLLNNGGYVPQVISAVPAWTGEDGETVLNSNGNEVRQYVYSETPGWNYGFPISSKYSWDYIAVTTANSSATKGISFGYTFRQAPVVLTSFLGYNSAGGTPDSIDDFDTGLTKVISSPYAITTTGFTAAVYSGDGTKFPGAYNLGLSWIAIG